VVQASSDRAGFQGSRAVKIDDLDAVGSDKPFAVQVADMLDDVRDALEQDLSRAQTAAVSLLGLLTSPSAPAELGIVRGGLAPWQKRKIDRYLQENLRRSIHVDQLADHACLSVSHFCRAFKKSFGNSPHNYIIQLRLELAQKLMLTTDEPLSQIATDCGFADQAHLTKLFRRWLNESPRAWRRRNLTEAQADAINRRN
jgi:AraC-like DNA-binding protein